MASMQTAENQDSKNVETAERTTSEAAERAKDLAVTMKDKAVRWEHRAEESMQQTTQRLVHALSERPRMTVLAAGGAAFALASAIGAAEVAVAAAGAYAAYRWLGSAGSAGGRTREAHDEHETERAEQTH
jgi:hypothetical protein